MDRYLNKLMGTYLPKHYYAEVIDKLHAMFPKVPATRLLRALIGLWFDGKIKLTEEIINKYTYDARKHNQFRPRGFKFPPNVQREGWAAAEQGMPQLANPYPAEVEHEAWDLGWRAFFNK